MTKVILTFTCRCVKAHWPLLFISEAKISRLAWTPASNLLQGLHEYECLLSRAAEIAKALEQLSMPTCFRSQQLDDGIYVMGERDLLIVSVCMLSISSCGVRVVEYMANNTVMSNLANQGAWVDSTPKGPMKIHSGVNCCLKHQRLYHHVKLLSRQLLWCQLLYRHPSCRLIYL